MYGTNSDSEKIVSQVEMLEEAHAASILPFWFSSNRAFHAYPRRWKPILFPQL